MKVGSRLSRTAAAALAAATIAVAVIAVAPSISATAIARSPQKARVVSRTSSSATSDRPAINNAARVRQLSEPFTIAALPDTQVYSEDGDPGFQKQVEWVLANAAEKNIIFVARRRDVHDAEAHPSAVLRPDAGRLRHHVQDPGMGSAHGRDAA